MYLFTNLPPFFWIEDVSYGSSANDYQLRQLSHQPTQFIICIIHS